MKKRLPVLLLVFVILLQLLSVGAMATEETEILDPMFDDPMYERYAGETVEAPVLFTEEGTEEEKKDTRVTFDDFSTRALEDGETLHRGVDVSYYQGKIDWVAAKEDGVEFAIIRGGYRGWGTGGLKEDPYFDTYMKDALEAGIEVGVYVFSQATSVEEAKEEAQFLIDMVKDYDITLPLVLDFEFASNGKGRLWDAYEDGTLDKTSAAELCQAFCDTAEAAGYDGMVYVNPTMVKNYVDVTNLEKIWLAHYTGTKEEYRDEETGKFPASYYEGAYEFWQCASKGKVDGISGNVDINFWFKPQPPKEPFKDVVSTDWFYEDVVYVYENKLTTGTSDTTYEPGLTTSRGQLVTMLYRMAGEPEVSGETGFTDLTQDYYKDAVLWAFQNGIVTGRSDTKFDPEADVTRQELATILYRYAVESVKTEETEDSTQNDTEATGEETTESEKDPSGETTSGESQPAAQTETETDPNTPTDGDEQEQPTEETKDPLEEFGDANLVMDFAKTGTVWAVEHSIITGKPGPMLAPLDNASRAEIAAVLHRYMVLLEAQDASLREKILGMTIDDSILLGLEGTEEELRTLIQGVIDGTVVDKQPDDAVAGAANAIYRFLQENFTLAEKLLTADTWTLSADIKGNYYLISVWNGETETEQLLRYDGSEVSLVEQ